MSGPLRHPRFACLLQHPVSPSHASKLEPVTQMKRWGVARFQKRNLRTSLGAMMLTRGGWGGGEGARQGSETSASLTVGPEPPPPGAAGEQGHGHPSLWLDFPWPMPEGGARLKEEGGQPLRETLPRTRGTATQCSDSSHTSMWGFQPPPPTPERELALSFRHHSPLTQPPGEASLHRLGMGQGLLRSHTRA